jgi:DNA-binding IclR family transcriptional regulator
MPVKTAETVFEVIEAMIELDQPRFTDLSSYLEMPRSTLHDHLQSLRQLGMVVKTDETYQVGMRFLEIGERARRQRDLFHAGRDQTEKLSQDTGEYASLMIEERGLGVLLYVARGDNAVDLQVWGGRAFALTTNAPGKAILAHLPAGRVDEILEQHGLPQHTANTITDRDELVDELETIRDQGYASASGELVEGVRTISAPVIRGHEVAGAIAVGGPDQRMRGERFENELPDRLLRASNVVELNLSYG